MLHSSDMSASCFHGVGFDRQLSHVYPASLPTMRCLGSIEMLTLLTEYQHTSRSYKQQMRVRHQLLRGYCPDWLSCNWALEQSHTFSWPLYSQLFSCDSRVFARWLLKLDFLHNMFSSIELRVGCGERFWANMRFMQCKDTELSDLHWCKLLRSMQRWILHGGRNIE